VLGLPQVGIAAGRVADLVLVPDMDLGAIVAGWADSRVVVRGGRVVAVTRTDRDCLV
jgi:cytosine deaminase